jgi:hypothetical protein
MRYLIILLWLFCSSVFFAAVGFLFGGMIVLLSLLSLSVGGVLSVVNRGVFAVVVNFLFTF